MTAKTKPPQIYTPSELKTLFEALNTAPSYLSKRYVLKNMLGWSDEDLRANLQMKEEEATQQKMGNKGIY
jgi:hypothetical protein